MQRRTLVGGSLFAALSSATWTAETAGAAQRIGDDDKVAGALREIVDELKQQRVRCGEALCPELELIRTNQRTFARAQGKFPDFIEVSLDVWERVYDWLVRTGQVGTATRLPDGSYALTFCFTQVILRPELANQFVSLGYDGK